MAQDFQDFAGKAAVVTGAGSGIGRGIARALAGQGMRVAACDIDLEAAEATARALGAGSAAFAVDVADLASVQRLAAAVQARLGRIDLLVNNAGVAMHGRPIEAVPPEDWDRVIGVNLKGVIHGVQAFLPRMRAQGTGGHIVNTASIGGLLVPAGLNPGPYSMTKFGVVALSEALEQELEGSGIGVSVLCPGPVKTAIAAPAGRAGVPALAELLAGGIEPEAVGDRLVAALRAGEFFILTHSFQRPVLEARHQRIVQALDRAAEWEASRR